MNYKKIIKSDILETISKIADENRYEIFVVGGYVRDSILKKKGKIILPLPYEPIVIDI